jgi:hypothetical protein
MALRSHTTVSSKGAEHAVDKAVDPAVATVDRRWKSLRPISLSMEMRMLERFVNGFCTLKVDLGETR